VRDGGVLEIAALLPDIELSEIVSGRPVALRPPIPEATILVGIHSAACRGCLAYLEEFGPLEHEFRFWDARLLVTVPGGAPAAQVRFGRLLRDDGERFSSRRRAAVLVADRYGQIFDLRRAGPRHDFPAPGELLEWLKYLGTLCPE
jgi:hypothetical protein